MTGHKTSLIPIQVVFDGGTVTGMTDAELVERFANAEQKLAEVAFSAIVERHGPMVMRVCRAALHDEHDAEDAFQAVFLVLVQKAANLWVHDSLGPWLHGVAVNVSARAKTQAARRLARERDRPPALHTNPEPVEQDVVAAVHEELGRLPDRFRAAVVLCDLEGLSHEVAARQLGWPVGTVKSRQARGRERLRRQLDRRGLSPDDRALAMAIARPAVAPSTFDQIVSAAANFKAGHAVTLGLVSAKSFALAQAFLRATMLNRIKLTIVSTFAVGVIAAGAAAMTGAMLGEERPPIATRRGGPPAPVRPTTARPTAGSLFEMRFAADTAHDSDAVDQSSYRWVKIDPRSHISLDGLLTRVENDKNQVVSVKLDRQNLTERDLLEVKKIVDQRGQPAISFLLTRDGAERFGALTRAHLPETEEAPRYRLAIIVQGSVVSMPVINAEIRDTGIVEFGPDVLPAEIDRLARLLAEAAAYNAPAPTAKAVRDYAEAISEAAAVDLPALAMANRISVESATSGSRLIVTSPKAVESFWRALRPRRIAPGMGVLAATLSFFRDDELIRKVWVNEGGEWGFERPGTSWTTGSDAELWRLVKPRLLK